MAALLDEGADAPPVEFRRFDAFGDRGGHEGIPLKIYFDVSRGEPLGDMPATSGNKDESRGIIEIRGIFVGEVAFSFQGDSITYHHRHGEEPAMVLINGKAWQDLRKPFYLNNYYNFSKAAIVEKSGQDRFVGINRGGEFILVVKKQFGGHEKICSVDIAL